MKKIISLLTLVLIMYGCCINASALSAEEILPTTHKIANILTASKPQKLIARTTQQ